MNILETGSARLAPTAATPLRKLTRRALAAAGVTLGLFALAAPMARADQVDDYVHAEMTKRKIPGLSLAVLRDGKVIKEQAYGVASIELNVPVTLDTSCVLASMSKVFAASGIMLLVQDGKITLDEPIGKILPQVPSKWAGITIRQCLSHTSGIPDVMVDDMNVTPVAGDREEMFEKLGKLPVHTPGEAVAYNQTAYAMLGMVIEKISGMDYEEFVRQRILKPAKMTQAAFGDAWAILPGRSDLYTADDITKDHTRLAVRDGGPVIMTDKIYRYGSKAMPDFLAPAGLLNGSIKDLVNWEQTMEHGSLLTPASLREMTTPYKLNDGKNGDFGLAFLITPLGPFKTVSYGGGAATWRLSVPEKHLTVIVLTNLQASQPQALAAGILGLYDPALAEAAR